MIAEVAIAEDPRVRLTTNIIDCDPEKLELGQPVEVRFQQFADVWLPVFTPPAADQTAPAAMPEDEIAPSDFGKYVRPMLTTEKFEDHSAITGIGASTMGRRLMVPPLSLTIEACKAAVADAGLTFDDIDGLSTYPGLDIAGWARVACPPGGCAGTAPHLDQRRYGHLRAGRLGDRGDDGRGHGNGQTCAVLSHPVGGHLPTVDEGRPDVAPPWWCAHHQLAAAVRRYLGGTYSGAERSRHFHRYGTTRETLGGWIALNQRANAALNPTAIYRDPMTMDDYLSARMITTPFGLYDCDVPCDAPSP